MPPILTNAYFAVDGVDRNVVEAARGMGMTGRQILLRIELPLALPLIFAGIRIAAVFVIATATIAAVAGGGGLGDIIVNQASYRLSGVVAASLCVSALAFAAAIVLGVRRGRFCHGRSFQGTDSVRVVPSGDVSRKETGMVRKHARRAVKAAFAIALAIPIVLGGTANAQPTAPTIVVGTKNFTEAFVLGQLYKQALEAKGYKVAYKENIGCFGAARHRADEREGQLRSGVHRHPRAQHRAREEGAEDRARRRTRRRRRSRQKRGLHAAAADAVLRRRLVRGAEDDRVEVRAEDDLRPEEGAEPLVRRATRSATSGITCLLGLKKIYGLTKIKFVQLGTIPVTTLIDQGKVTGGDIFTTEPAFATGKYTALADDKHIFGFQNVAPVVSKKLVSEYGAKFAADRQRRQREADERGDDRDEQGGRGRQEDAGGRGQGLPEGERPGVGSSRQGQAPSRACPCLSSARTGPGPRQTGRGDARILAAMARAAILTIGNELLSGDVLNTNGSWIAGRLAGLGVEVALIAVLPDEIDPVAAFVREQSAAVDALLVTGGLGGTPDDVTREAIAAAFGVPQVEQPDVAAALRARFRRDPEYAARWALLPEGSRPLENPLGGAPGFAIGNVYVLPGLPAEMEAMFETLVGELRAGAPIGSWRRRYPTTESRIVGVLQQAAVVHPGVLVGSYPSFEGGVSEVEIVMRSADPDALAAAGAWIEAAVDEALGAGDTR